MRNLKRALSLAVASVMLLGMMVVGTSAGYADVTSAHNEEAIDVVKAVGIMIGDDKGNFNPDQKVTRNEMAVVMANMLKLDVDDFSGTKLPFTDVPTWAAPYVAACYANGIVSGTSATTYGGSAQVTAAQAALMMMKALGYFQFQKDFDNDWQLATVKKASEIELMDGITAGASTALTRNEVAQLALNALESNVVGYSGDEGTDIKTTDGTVIKVGYTIKYDVTYKTSYNYNKVDGDDGIQQLAEKLYKSKLIKETATDAFERPANKWSYDGDKIGTYADSADYTYTDAVESDELYDTLDLSKTYTANYYKNGKQVEEGFKIKNGDENTKAGAKGTLTEVYVIKNANTGDTKEIRIVEIDSYVGKITAVTKNDDDERIVKIGTKEYETDAFEKNDIVLYTESQDGIESMVLAEKLTGEVTKKVGSAWYVDGTKYSVSKNADVSSIDIKDDVEFYLDAYGYIIKMDKTDEDVSVDNLAYVINAGDSRGTWATLRLADGTKMTVDTDEDYGKDGENLVGYIVSFKETDDGYELKQKSDEKLGNEKFDYKSGKTAMDGIDLNSKTVFLYNIGDGDSYKVYTGYKNAPSFDNGVAVAYLDDDDVAVWVYVEVDDVYDDSSDLTLIVFDDDADLVVEADDVSYYEYNAIVDGEITTLKVEASKNISKSMLWSSYSLNSDGLVKSYTEKTNLDGNGNYTIKVEDDVVTIGSKRFAWTDDVAVYVVDDDCNVGIIDIEDIQDDDNKDYDPYGAIWYVLDDGEVDTIVLFEK